MTDRAASKPTRSEVHNLQIQDLFDFLRICGCSTIVIPENADQGDPTTVLSLDILASSDQPDVVMELRRHMLGRLLEYLRVREEGPIQNDISVSGKSFVTDAFWLILLSSQAFIPYSQPRSLRFREAIQRTVQSTSHSAGRGHSYYSPIY
jgi:hypothetical protein